MNDAKGVLSYNGFFEVFRAARKMRKNVNLLFPGSFCKIEQRGFLDVITVDDIRVELKHQSDESLD